MSNKKTTALQVDHIPKDIALQSLTYAYSLVFERTMNLPTQSRVDILNILSVLESEIEQRTDDKVMVMVRIRHYVGSEDI